MSNVQPQMLLRAKFHEALRSGKYHQTKGSYRNLTGYYVEDMHTSFCILGLAYHIMDGHDWNTYRLIEELEEAYGFRNPLTLMSMNDAGCSFSTFIRLIEDHPDFIYKT